MNLTKIEYTVQYTLTDIYNVFVATYSVVRLQTLFLVMAALSVVVGFMSPKVQYAWLCGVLLVLLVIGTRYWLRYVARKTLASPAFSAQQEISFDETGLSVCSDGSQSQISWLKFLNWRDTTTAFLLYMTPYTFLIVPKRCLSAPDQTALEELIGAHVQKYVANNRLRNGMIILFVVVTLISFVTGLLTARH